MVEESEAVQTLLQNPPGCPCGRHTGRDAPESLLAIADLVTEMRDVKHPFKAGIRAQKGIEF
jgi:cob(I)alamin adenosyltransferase